MLAKYFLLILIEVFLYQQTTSEACDAEEFYRYLLGQLETVKRSVETLNAKVDDNSDRQVNSNLLNYPNTTAIFDIRFDALPPECLRIELPKSCAEATQCSRSTGIYNITTNGSKTIQVFCDNHNFEGDWLYILKRVDGSENFNRPWSDYVQGFGNVAGEHWIGLENLYVLTHNNGPQELNVFIENFEGRQVFARYDNFVVGNASEKYKLISLGRYWGTAGDSLFNQLVSEFSTYDVDNDALKEQNCAAKRKGGFWFKDCSKANPTGRYLRGIYTNLYEGSYWRSFEGENYSQKTIIFMIRRQRMYGFMSK